MTLAELLTSEMDLASLSALARQGFAWWLDELAALLPPRWRERLSSRPANWIEPASGGWRIWRHGRPWEAPAAGDAKKRVGLLAPPGMVLTREIAAPLMPAADVRRMVVLDIDRLSPLPVDLIHFDVDIVHRGDGDGRQRVMVGIIGRDDAAGLLAEARRAGYAPVALAARAGGDDVPPRFDFLPQTVEAAGGETVDRVRFYAWVAAAGLILANLGVLVGRDIIETSRLRQTVDAQAPGVAVVQRLQRRVTAEDARRRQLVERGVREDPLRLLDAITPALPSGAFVQHLEWNGHTLRMVGYRHDDVDLKDTIAQTGRFGPPKIVSGAPTAPGAPFRPFDLTAEARPGGRP